MAVPFQKQFVTPDHPFAVDAILNGRPPAAVFWPQIT